MSAIWAVVPVKRIAAAKQRLSDVCAPILRRALALAMLEDVLTALAAVPALAGIAVVSEDERAASRLARDGAALLTLPADIPLVRSEDVSRVIAAHRFPRGFTIVPSRDKRGRCCRRRSTRQHIARATG